MKIFKFITDYFTVEHAIKSVKFNSVPDNAKKNTVAFLAEQKEKVDSKINALQAKISRLRVEYGLLDVEIGNARSAYYAKVNVKNKLVEDIELIRKSMIDAKQFDHCGDRARTIAAKLYDEYLEKCEEVTEVNKECKAMGYDWDDRVNKHRQKGTEIYIVEEELKKLLNT